MNHLIFYESLRRALTDLPPCLSQAALARVVMGLQFGGIAAVLAADKIFPALGMEVPQMLAQMQDKKLGVAMGIYLLGNALQNQLSATGAFEVFYDGKQVIFVMALLQRMAPNAMPLLSTLERT